MKITPIRAFAFILFVHLLASANAFAQKLPALPRDPPQENEMVDEGYVSKSAEALMKSCRSAKERELGAKGIAKSQIQSRARDICFCIAKDVKRRHHVPEMDFLNKYVKDQFDDDHVYTEEEDLWLHEYGKTEKNCSLNPKYRFGQPEPRLPADPSIQNSLQKDKNVRQK